MMNKKAKSVDVPAIYFDFFFTFILEDYASLETGPILSHMRLEKNKCENKSAI